MGVTNLTKLQFVSVGISIKYLNKKCQPTFRKKAGALSERVARTISISVHLSITQSLFHILLLFYLSNKISDWSDCVHSLILSKKPLAKFVELSISLIIIIIILL